MVVTMVVIVVVAAGVTMVVTVAVSAHKLPSGRYVNGCTMGSLQA
jgi:hypothetical protein